MGAKMQIMAWDAKRQMEIKMQKTIEALVMQKRQKALENMNGDSSGITLLTQAELQQAPLLILKVRRNNLIEESLTQVCITSLHFLVSSALCKHAIYYLILISSCVVNIAFTERNGSQKVAPYRVHWRGRR